MKKFYFFLSLLIAFTLSIGQVWAGTVQGSITFDFEDNTAHRTSGNNSYTSNSYSENGATISCTYMDVVTSGTPLSGSANAMGRIAKNTTNSPVLLIGPIDFTDKTITGISYYTKGVTAMSQLCEYSTDNSNWTTAKSLSSMPTSSTKESSSTLNVEGTSTFYVRITTSVSSSTGSNRDLQIDDVVISYSYQEATPTCSALPAPTNPSSTPAQNSVVLNWNAVSGAIGYKVVFNGVDYNIASGTTTKTIEGLVADTEYEWTVAAKGDGTTYCEVGTATAQQSVTTLSDCDGNKVKYTVASTSSVSASNAPAGTSATFANTYSTKEQMTKNNSQTLTLSGYAGKTISGLTLSMRSNASAGAGTFSMNIGSTTVVEISSTTFNKWFDNTSYGTDYRDVHVDFEDEVAVSENENIQVVITATTNSLFCQSFTFCYSTTPVAAVAKPSISGTVNFYPSTEVTLNCTTSGATIYYTTDGSDPKTSNTKSTYSAPFTLNASATVKAIASKGSDWSATNEKEFTKVTPMTVAQALAASAGSGKYVEGVITSITEVSIANANATYVISDISNGIATSQMIIYRGKYLAGAAFTSSDQIHVGDRVVVSGSISQYQNVNQMAQGNQIETISAPAVAAPAFTPDGGGFVVSAEVTIACSTANSEIYYTTNGVNPTKSSTPYNGAISLTETTTIKAIAYVGNESSMVVEKTFTKTAPKTVAQACADLEDSSPINNVAVEGIVYSVTNISNNYATYWISDDGTDGDDVIQVYNGKGLNGADVAEGGVRVGDKVIVFGNVTIYNTTKEFSSGSRILSLTRKTVTAVAVSGTPTKTSYKIDEAFAPAGLTVTVTFNDNSQATVAVADCEWDKNPATFTEAGTNKSVTVKATYEEIQSDAYEVTGLTVREVPTFNNSNYEWQLVTSDAQLVAGKYYIIAYTSANKTAVYSSGDYMTAQPTTFTDGVITAADRTTAGSTVFELGGNSTAWTLTEPESEKQLGATTGKNISWTSNKAWTISIDEDNEATIANTTADCGELRFNNAANPQRFKVYANNSNLPLPQLFVWAPVIYKLRYDANGGEDAPATQIADSEGKAIVTSATPTPPTGKVLDNWNTLANGQGETKVAGDEIDLSNADVTLYAQWREPGIYTLTYNANGGTLIDGKSAIDPEDVVEGTAVTAAEAIYEKEGFLFAGWQFEENIYNEGQQFTMPGKNVELVAQWNTLNISEYTLVTAIDQLQAGDKIVIVAAGYNAAMGAQNGSIRSSISVSKTADKSRLILNDDEPVELTLGNGSSAGKYTLKEGDKYFYSTTDKNVGTRDDSFEWTITIDENGTTIDAGTAGTMQYNSGSPRFITYNSTQKPVVIFKKANLKRETVFGRYGTVCMSNGGIVNGATLFEIAYKDAQKIYFDEVLDGVMIAGRPYIFKANPGMNSFTILYTDQLNAAAGSYNGLVGFIGASSEDKYILPTSGGYYILSNNQYREVLGGTAYVVSNRAYIYLEDVPDEESAPAPGRRRVAMGYTGSNVATGGDAVQQTGAPVKVLKDGQLLILREGKMYDATGRLVK